MLIDGHLHILQRDGYVKELLNQMDDLGIQRGVLLGLPTEWAFMGSLCGGNEHVRRAVQQNPDRFIGGVYLDPRDPDSVDTLHRYADAGFRTAKLHPTAGFFLDDSSCFRLYEELDKMGWPVTVHCGLTNVPYADGSGRTTHSKYAHPIYLDGVVRLFPRIKWIVAHMGWPFFDVVWGLVQFNDNVYMDLSGPHAQINGFEKIRREGFGFTCDVDLFGRMIWGSDGIETLRFFHQTRDTLQRLRADRIRDVFGQTMAALLGMAE